MFDFQKYKRLDHTNVKAMAKAEGSIIRHYSSVKGRENLHVYLCAAVEHAIANNGGDVLSNLFNKMPENGPKRAIRAWAEAFTTMTYSKDKAGNGKFLGTDKVYNWKDGVKAGETMPFYVMPEVKKDNERPFALEASLQKLIERAENLAKENKLPEKDGLLVKRIRDAIIAHHKSFDKPAANANDVRPARKKIDKGRVVPVQMPEAVAA